MPTSQDIVGNQLLDPGIAQRRLIEWCRDRTDELIGSDKLLTRMPSTYFLPCRFQRGIADVFNSRRRKTATDFPIQTLELED